MPKEKKSTAARLRGYVKEFGNVFCVDGSLLFCTACSKTVATERKSQVQQHMKSAKHIAKSQRKSAKQQSFSQSISMQNEGCVSLGSSRSSLPDEFSLELCKALISADIPLYAVQNATFRFFLENTVIDLFQMNGPCVTQIYGYLLMKAQRCYWQVRGQL